MSADKSVVYTFITVWVSVVICAHLRPSRPSHFTAHANDQGTDRRTLIFALPPDHGHYAYLLPVIAKLADTYDARYAGCSTQFTGYSIRHIANI